MMLIFFIISYLRITFGLTRGGTQGCSTMDGAQIHSDYSTLCSPCSI